jgi:hypothetical protein
VPSVDIETRITSPQPAVWPRLQTVLRGYAQRDDVTLAHDLPVGGADVAVPVTVEVDAARTNEPFALGLSMHAVHHASLFPVFDGEVRSEAGGPLESTLRLTGTYRAPLGVFGSLSDATLFGRAAERSLRAFLERVRCDTVEEIRRGELDVRMRHRT